MNLTLTLLAETFTIHRLAAHADIPLQVLDSPFFAVARTMDELSLVLPESVEITSDRFEAGWVCLKVEGPLDFSLVGILSGIAGALEEAGVSIFALSTFDTDYILVKREQAGTAREALVAAGHLILGGE